MADIFISYARADKARVAPLVAALEAQGWSVWWDPHISAGQEFDDLITGELKQAKCVLAVWTPISVTSRWVRGEARTGADRGVLVPVRFDNAELPIDVRAIHTIDLDGWNEDPAAASFQNIVRALTPLVTPGHPAQAKADKKRGICVCVLPFSNMSGDPEQEYFSDGISEDIITDLSKVSALAVLARNTAFTFKGKAVEIPHVARQTNSTHVLEGSVRKSGNRVRITAQLIDGTTGTHVWAERYDRDLSDIFKLQDEISEAIVKALRLKLLPEEKHAIENRGTASVEAYDLYLKARTIYYTGNSGNKLRCEEIMRLCQRAAEIDPNYAQAWALLASAHARLRAFFGDEGDGGQAAAERAIALNPNLADAHAVMATVLRRLGRHEESLREVETALRLEPNSYEANSVAASGHYRARRFNEAAPYYEKAVAALEDEHWSAAMMLSCYKALGDTENAKRAARIARTRCEKIIAEEPDNGAALSNLVAALAALGETEAAKAYVKRALLIDPDNIVLHYNLGCTLALELKDYDASLDILGKVAARPTAQILQFFRSDPDLDDLRTLPRFKAMLEGVEKALAAKA